MLKSRGEGEGGSLRTTWERANPTGMAFEPFWSESGCIVRHFWPENGYILLSSLKLRIVFLPFWLERGSSSSNEKQNNKRIVPPLQHCSKPSPHPALSLSLKQRGPLHQPYELIPFFLCLILLNHFLGIRFYFVVHRYSFRAV